mgnify:CR=1 FL=1
MNQEIRDQFNTLFGAWTSYTPAWTSSGTAPAIGNGTIAGRYMKIGRTVLCHINVIFGSTSTYGTGNYSFSLPATSANAGATLVSSAQLLVTDRWGGEVVIGTNTTTCSPFFSSSATNTRLGWMTSALPETSASGTQLRMTFIYEAAS